MGDDDMDRQKSLSNVRSFLAESNCLPEFIYNIKWDCYYFFNPDDITDEKFVENAKALIKVDKSHCICLVDLNADPEMEWSAFFFDERVLSADYMSYFDVPNRNDGELRMVIGRLGCASDMGQWCIYCEKQNEIGIIAFRDHHLVKKYLAAIDRLHPMPIEQAISTPHSYIYGHLTSDFRIELLRNYSGRP